MPDQAKENREELTERELEILSLVATGASNKEIASRLHISANTVKVHLRNIFAKIGVSSRTEAAMYAVNMGLVPMHAAAVEAQRVGQTLNSDISLESGVSTNNKLINRPSFWIVLSILVLSGLLLGIILVRQFSQNTVNDGNLSEIPARWQALSDLPSGRYGLAAVSYQNSIYIIGGRNPDNEIEKSMRYDSDNDAWVEIASKPTAVYDIQAGMIEGNIYVPGGCKTDGTPSQVLEIYHPLTDSWSQGVPMPKGVCGYGLVIFDGRVYLFGGWDGNDYLKDVFIYDPVSQTWSIGPPLPRPLAYAGAAVSERQIYLVGGYDGKNAHDTTEIFLPDMILSGGNPWRSGTPMPVGRYRMGVASIADIIYVIGGTTNSLESEFPAIAYFNQSGEWRSIDQPPVALGSGLGLTNLGVYIYAIGGMVDNEPKPGNYRYQAMYTFALPIIQK